MTANIRQQVNQIVENNCRATRLGNLVFCLDAASPNNYDQVEQLPDWSMVKWSTIWMQTKRRHYWGHSYIAFASTISIVLLVLWRWYTRYLDNGIANLYPELIFFEGKLSCPPQYATSSYLKRNLGSAGDLLDPLSFEQKSQVVAQLVKEKRIGDRGHAVINWLTFWE